MSPRQARVAVDLADAVLFVVDATVGVTDADAAVAAVLRRSGKPVVVAANKVDDAKAESDVAALWKLGLGEPEPVSALHGRGSGDLLDVILDALPDAPMEAEEAEGGPRRVALLGRPNVGKSSLLNKLAGASACAGRPGGGHDQGPGGRARRTRRHDLAVRRYGRHQAAVPREPGRGLLRGAAHRRGAGPGRGRRGPRSTRASR